MSNTYINEVLNSGENRGCDSFFQGTEIDLDELPRFRRARMRRADQVDDRMVGPEVVLPGLRIENVSHNDFASRG
jgi:hypothetical protein